MQDLFTWFGQQLQTNQFFSAAAMATFAAGAFAYFKGVPIWLYNRFLTHTTYTAVVQQDDELYDYMVEWTRTVYPHRKRKVQYVSKPVADNGMGYLLKGSDNNTKKILIELPLQDYFFTFANNRLLKITFDREKFEIADHAAGDPYYRTITIQGFFAKRAIDKLLRDVHKEYSDKHHSPSIYAVNHHQYYSNIGYVQGKTLDNIYMPNDIKSKIDEDVRNWIDSKPDYIRKGIPYKRGHCYYGLPGTGKTTMAKAISLKYNLGIYNLNLNSITSESQLTYILSEIPPYSILLIEDIDCYFDGRTPIKKDSPVSFSALLNLLDGINSPNSVLVIITTNDINKLDPALIRPGRIDLVQELLPVTEKEISEYMSMFYNKPIEITLPLNIPMCDVQNACLVCPIDSDAAIARLTGR